MPACGALLRIPCASCPYLERTTLQGAHLCACHTWLPLLHQCGKYCTREVRRLAPDGLMDLQASREPFDVITGKRTYRNMLIKSLGQTNDVQTENILSISLQLQEIFITAVEVVSVPARPKQKNAGKTGATENAGQKSAQETPKKRSALAALAGKGG